MYFVRTPDDSHHLFTCSTIPKALEWAEQNLLGEFMVVWGVVVIYRGVVK